jgi:hypothetical protein
MPIRPACREPTSRRLRHARTPHSHHGDFNDLVKEWPDVPREPSALVAEKDDALALGWSELRQRDRVLVQFDSNNCSTACLLPFDPARLGVHPMQARTSRQCVASLERASIVLCLGHGHARPDRITASKQSPEVRLKGDPKWRHYQMVCARDRSSSPHGPGIRAAVPPTHRIRMRPLSESERLFMRIGLLGVPGPSLSGRSAYPPRDRGRNGSSNPAPLRQAAFAVSVSLVRAGRNSSPGGTRWDAGRE